MEANLNDLTVAELKTVAEANGIDLESGAKKAEIVETIEEALSAHVEPAVAEEEPKEEAEEAPVAAPAEAPKASDSGTVAVYFKKNVSSANLGKFTLGYHILDKALADKWVALKGGKYARVATPKEVADHFSN